LEQYHLAGSDSLSSKYNRDNFLKRRKQNNVILIVCCGETEKNYFEGFKKLRLGTIKIYPILRPISPLQMVQEAIDRRDTNEFRQVWCVFDKDEFGNFDNAIELANKSDINCAFSNQAFELWFILHFEKRTGTLHKNNYKGLLETYLDINYDKPANNIYNKLSAKTDMAINNAKYGHQVHNKNGGKPSNWESCTTVYTLVEELLKWKKP
jgi:hypothetical protein